MIKRALALGLPLAIVLTIAVGESRQGPARQEPPQAVQMPEEWVPFSADMSVRHMGPHESTSGRFWRNRDGSTRLETWVASQPQEHLVSIKNIAHRLSYIKELNGDWSSAPMELPKDGWVPKKWRTDMPGLAEYLYKLDIGQGGTATLTATSGMAAMQYSTRLGNVLLMAPELNMFPVVQQHLATGRRETYWNIHIGDQELSLFEPPAGTQIAVRQEPRAIVDRKAAAVRAAQKVR